MLYLLPMAWLLGCGEPPKPAPPPPPRRVLRIVPADAEVRVDGVRVTLPLDQPAAGEVQVTAQRLGFEPLSVRVGPGEHNLSLVPLQLALEVRSHPAGAQVRVDGVVRGLTPLSGEIKAGQHSVEIALDGYNVETSSSFVDSERLIDAWLDPEGQLVDLLRVFPSANLPKGLAISSDGNEIWLAPLGGWGFDVYDLHSGALLHEEKLPDAGSVEVLLDDARGKAYFSQMETARVYEVDRATRKVTRRFDTHSVFSKVVVFSADQRHLFISNWKGNAVSEIDLATGALIRNLKTVRTPRGLWASPDGKELYVASFGGGGLGRIELATGRTTRVASGGSLRSLVASPDGDLLYVTDMARDALMVFDRRDGSWRKLSDTGENPNTLDISPDGNVLFVSNRGRNGPGGYLTVGKQRGSVWLIDAHSGALLDAIPGGMQCTALDLSDDGRILVFSDFRDDRLRVVSIPPYEVLRSGGGGRGPRIDEDLFNLDYAR